MSTNRSRRIDPSTAERLLDGTGVGTSAGQAALTGHAALAGLLAAARTTAGDERRTDGVLPGEEAALAAFREARRNPAPLPRRRTMASTALARAFSAKALAAAFAATALSGVAVAAGTGHLPSALGGRPARGGTAAPATTPASSAGTARYAGPGVVASGRPRLNGVVSPVAGRSRNPEADPSESPGSPAARGTDAVAERSAGLCRLYADRLAAGAAARTVLADTQLAPLVEAAGDADRVDGYCAAVAARPKGSVNAGDSAKGNDGDPGTDQAPDRTKGLRNRFLTGLPFPPGQPTRPGGPPGGNGTVGGDGPAR
ncbi:hypothetical protein [Kitasatospora sp. HPMI-4]|uniref:hypothetical protein n=1 Tax=Kitasatospora sp. HPMI-4 TaxID=3448443 RepID=UPI003F1A6F07